MPEQVIQCEEKLEGEETERRGEVSPFGCDIPMGRIWIELFTRATLYAGAIGLIVGVAAALLLGD